MGGGGRMIALVVVIVVDLSLIFVGVSRRDMLPCDLLECLVWWGEVRRVVGS